MITKEELIEFKNFCANRHNINIKEAVIDEYLYTEKSREYFSSSSNNVKEMECGYNASVCAHVNFDTVKCDACSY